MAKKNKLEKFGFIKAIIYLSPNARETYDHPRVKLAHRSDWSSDNLWLTFQRHRLDARASISLLPLTGGEVSETREMAGRYPWLDVGRAPYSKTYDGRLNDAPEASPTELTRIAKILSALSDHAIYSLEQAHDALRDAGCPVEIDYGNGITHTLDLPDDQRGMTRAWAYGSDACRAMADMEAERARLAEERAVRKAGES